MIADHTGDFHRKLAHTVSIKEIAQTVIELRNEDECLWSIVQGTDLIGHPEFRRNLFHLCSKRLDRFRGGKDHAQKEFVR